MKIKSILLSLVGALAVTALPASAHHSFAMYDLSVSKTLTGKLTRFIVGANHSQLIFNLVDANGKEEMGADGKPVTWGVETGSASQMAEKGVTVKSFKLGTVMTVTLHPLRDGRNFGALRNTDGLLVACGMAVPQGGCTADTGKVYVDGSGS